MSDISKETLRMALAKILQVNQGGLDHQIKFFHDLAAGQYMFDVALPNAVVNHI